MIRIISQYTHSQMNIKDKLKTAMGTKGAYIARTSDPYYVLSIYLSLQNFFAFAITSLRFMKITARIGMMQSIKQKT